MYLFILYTMALMISMLITPKNSTRKTCIHSGFFCGLVLATGLRTGVRFLLICFFKEPHFMKLVMLQVSNCGRDFLTRLRNSHVALA